MPGGEAEGQEVSEAKRTARGYSSHRKNLGSTGDTSDSQAYAESGRRYSHVRMLHVCTVSAPMMYTPCIGSAVDSPALSGAVSG